MCAHITIQTCVRTVHVSRYTYLNMLQVLPQVFVSGHCLSLHDPVLDLVTLPVEVVQLPALCEAEVAGGGQLLEL